MTPFNVDEPLPVTVLATCVDKANSWEPAAHHYRDIEPVKP